MIDWTHAVAQVRPLADRILLPEARIATDMDAHHRQVEAVCHLLASRMAEPPATFDHDAACAVLSNRTLEALEQLLRPEPAPTAARAAVARAWAARTPAAKPEGVRSGKSKKAPDEPPSDGG